MEVDRADGRNPNQLRPLACSCSILHRAHGSASWSQGFRFIQTSHFYHFNLFVFTSKCYFCYWVGSGDTKVLAAVYGPKAGTKKNENPEKASIEVIWKPRTGQIGNFLFIFPFKYFPVRPYEFYIIVLFGPSNGFV